MIVSAYERRNKEGYKGNEDIQFDRGHISLPFTGKVDFGQLSWKEQKILHGFPELTIIVGEVFKKVGKEIMKRLSVFRVFLSAMGAEPFLDEVTAV